MENQDAERVARPAVVAKETLQAGLLDACLLVNGNGCAGGVSLSGLAQARVVSLRPAKHGIDERSGRGAKVERRDGAAIARFHERLKFRRREQQFVRAVRIVVK